MEDFVSKADRVMEGLKEQKSNPKTGKTYEVMPLTTSQIRKFLTAINTVTNKVNMYKIKHIGESNLSDELAAEVKYLKVKIIYQAGRNKVVEKFVKQSRIVDQIDSVGYDIKKYDELAKYVEALVAYHKYYGGHD